MKILREYQDFDSKFLFEWINDPQVVKFNSKYRPVKWTDHSEWLKNILSDNNVIFRMIDPFEKESPIGSCQLILVDKIKKVAELRIRIGDIDKLGKGYGTIAVKELTDIGFSTKFCSSIKLWVRSDNSRAIRSYLKAGFTPIEIVGTAAFDDNPKVEMLIMEIRSDGKKSIGIIQIENARNKVQGRPEIKLLNDFNNKLPSLGNISSQGSRNLINIISEKIPWRINWILQRAILLIPRLAYFVLKKSGVHHRAI